MSDLDNFIAMIDRAGYEFKIIRDSVCSFKKDGEILDMHGVTSVEVYGVFYDHLYAEFDDEGFLLAISSHVTFLPDETAAIRRCKLPVTKIGEKPDAQ